MKFTKIILLFSLLLLLVAPVSISQSVIGKWSGTVKVTEISSGPLGSYQRDVSTVFRDNVGRGQVTETSKRLLNGNVICEGMCSGSGEAILNEVIIEKAEGIYRIHAISPAYACDFTGSLCEFPHIDMHPTDLLISDQPIVKENVLTGTISSTTTIALNTTVTYTITWNLSRTVDIYLIVTPQDYDNWLPKPGRDEKTVGAVMNLSLKLQDRNGGPPSIKAKEFELRLLGTSREPGIALNYPVNDPKTTPDIQFLTQQWADTSEEAQVLTIDCRGLCTTGNFKIASFDGGAYTILTAVAILEDDTRIDGSLLVRGGTEQILIPKRIGGSKTGAKWFIDNNYPADMDDLDESRGNSFKGDGLSAYEEYRGVVSENEFGSRNPVKWDRLDPKKKDLGVKINKAELGLFTEGTNWFENASDLNVIRFYESEIDMTRWLNKNFNTAHIYDQFVLLLYKGPLSHLGVGAIAATFTTNINPDIPRNTYAIVIDIPAVSTEYNKQMINASPDRLRFTIPEFLANTVAHEMGHGVNVWHHGDPADEKPNQTATAPEVSPYRTFRVFDRHGAEVTLRPTPLNGSIGKSGDGTLESGDPLCMMAYCPYYNWAYSEGADFAKIYNQLPLLAIGKKFCASGVAKEFNQGSIVFFGHSASGKGNCLSQIKLKP